MKKRNPQDATRRNVQAANKRLAALERRVKYLERCMANIGAPAESTKQRSSR